MDNNMDLSSVVSLIMQHPEIVAQIASLAKANETGGSVSEPSVPEVETVAEEITPRVSEKTPDIKRQNRERLFSALKPYLSSERAKTLSSVEAMVAIFDTLNL